MKRRNVDSLKVRRPVKKIPKIYDGFYTGVVVYVKLILLWICVMGGDYILEFRLEYLYPIYLLLQNSYEAYKFQGVAFALLLACVVVSVDVICLGIIPGPWLYLLGSLAVWSHVGWLMAPLGPLILLPTLIYIDGKSIRPLPSQTLSPLAAHCVGFPLVSLGFGLKSFIGSRLKQRTRNDVGRQNELLYSLLWDALPYTASPISQPPPIENEVIQNGGGPLAITNSSNNNKKPSTPLPLIRRKSMEIIDEQPPCSSSTARAILCSSSANNNNSSHNHHHHSSSISSSGIGLGNGSLLFNSSISTSSSSNSSSPSSPTTSTSSTSGYSSSSTSSNHILIAHNNNVSLNPNSTAISNSNSTNFLSGMSSNGTSTNNGLLLSTNSVTGTTGSGAANLTGQTCSCMSMTPPVAPAPVKKKKEKDDCCFKLESEVRKLRTDLHSFKAIESDLRGQISVLHSSEKNLRADIASLQGEHESLQLKYSALVSKSQEERQSYEKKLVEERKAKENAISKQKKALSECSGDCKKKLREAEREKENFRREIKVNEDKIVRIERELQNVKSTLLHEQKNKEVNQQPSQETTKLRSLLTNLQDQNALLESSLTAETRLKLDLFSALGEARRQLSIRDAMIKSKEDELDEVRGQLIDILAVSDFGSSNASSPPPQPQQQQQQLSGLSPSQHQQQQQQQQLYQRMNSSNNSCLNNKLNLSLNSSSGVVTSTSSSSLNHINHNHINNHNNTHNSHNNHNHLSHGHGPIGSIPLGVSVSCHNNYHQQPSSPILFNGGNNGNGLISSPPPPPILNVNPHGTIGSGVVNGMYHQQQQQQNQHPHGGQQQGHGHGNENLNFSSLIDT